MRILLVNPFCRLPAFIPSGLGYIASVLRRDGHDVMMLDVNGHGYSDEEVEKLVKALEFDIVGIGGLTSIYKYTKWFSGVVKKHKPNVPVIAGNMVATAAPETLLKNSMVDIAVIDEGEITAKELIRALEDGRPLKEVKGICYKEGQSLTRTSARERISDLDSLPYPAWDLFPMETYLNNSTASPASCGRRTVNIFSVRGCPYDCIFCSHPFGRNVYKRSASSIIDEIKELKKRYKVEFIYFSDDLFLIDEKWASEICDRLMFERLNIKWSASLRVNLVNEKILKRMNRAGCIETSYGFESGSQGILNRIQKRISVKQAEEAIRMTRAAGIKVTGSFIFGLPGETYNTVKETLDFIKRTDLGIYRFFYATPYPGTELYRLAKEMNRLPEDEDKYLESLGEMWKTFRVNLTDFSNEELTRLKNWAERTARKDLSLPFRLEEFIEESYRRYFVVRRSLMNSGLIATVKKVLLRILEKLRLITAEKVVNLF